MLLIIKFKVYDFLFTLNSNLTSSFLHFFQNGVEDHDITADKVDNNDNSIIDEPSGDETGQVPENYPEVLHPCMNLKFEM